jgi:hypothetical protein
LSDNRSGCRPHPHREEQKTAELRKKPFLNGERLSFAAVLIFQKRLEFALGVWYPIFGTGT